MIVTGDRSAVEIARELDAIIAKKSRETVLQMVFLGILAGAYIGFGAVAATTVLGLAGTEPRMSAAMARFLAASVFCIGLVLVIIPGSELFTGNVLMFGGRDVKVRRVLANWLFVYIGNFLGAALLAAAVAGSGLLGSSENLTPVGRCAADAAELKIGLGFGAAFLRGILCNTLVCLAVILALASRSVVGKILGIYFPITVFVLCGFEHSIANMYFLSAGLMAKGEFLSRFGAIWHNLVPVTLGNIVGGMVVILLHPGRWKRLGRALGGGADEEGDKAGDDRDETKVLPAG